MRPASLTAIASSNQRRRLLALFALLAIGALQVALAGHQFEHLDSDTLAEPCSDCLQMERFDDAVPDSPTVAAPYVRFPSGVAPTILRRDSAPLRHFSSRAPPSV